MVKDLKDEKDPIDFSNLQSTAQFAESFFKGNPLWNGNLLGLQRVAYFFTGQSFPRGQEDYKLLVTGKMKPGGFGYDTDPKLNGILVYTFKVNRDGSILTPTDIVQGNGQKRPGVPCVLIDAETLDANGNTVKDLLQIDAKSPLYMVVGTKMYRGVYQDPNLPTVESAVGAFRQGDVIAILTYDRTNTAKGDGIVRPVYSVLGVIIFPKEQRTQFVW